LEEDDDEKARHEELTRRTNKRLDKVSESLLENDISFKFEEWD
jgi:hypothetical protein